MVLKTANQKFTPINVLHPTSVGRVVGLILKIGVTRMIWPARLPCKYTPSSVRPWWKPSKVAHAVSSCSIFSDFLCCLGFFTRFAEVLLCASFCVVDNMVARDVFWCFSYHWVCFLVHEVSYLVQNGRTSAQFLVSEFFTFFSYIVVFMVFS